MKTLNIFEPDHGERLLRLNNLRMNVCAQMYDMMYDTLGVAEGDGMYLAPDQRIFIWGAKA